MTPPSRPSGEQVRTPHVDPAWREAFVTEQRLAGVPGDRIGDALATVDTHCAEAGESVHDAFGDPVAYARSLRPAAARDRLRPRTVLGIALGLVALVVLPRAVQAWAESGTVQVSSGDLVALLVLALLATVLLFRPATTLRWLLRRPWVPFAAPFGLLIVLIVPMALWRSRVLEADWAGPAGLGVLVLVASVLLTWPELSGGDPLRDPRASGSGRRPVDWLTALLFPFLTAIVLVWDALLRWLA